MIKLNKASLASPVAVVLAIALANMAVLDQAKTKEVNSSSLKVTKHKEKKTKEIKID